MCKNKCSEKAKVRNMFCIFITIYIFMFLLSENFVMF